MKMDRTEAVDILRGWATDFALVRYQASFSNFAFSGWGRVASTDGHELRLMADDRRAELVVQLASEIEFGYVDSRRVTGEEKKFKECVGLFFGPITDEGPTDSIVLAALES